MNPRLTYRVIQVLTLALVVDQISHVRQTFTVLVLTAENGWGRVLI